MKSEFTLRDLQCIGTLATDKKVQAWLEKYHADDFQTIDGSTEWFGCNPEHGTWYFNLETYGYVVPVIYDYHAWQKDPIRWIASNPVDGQEFESLAELEAWAEPKGKKFGERWSSVEEEFYTEANNFFLWLATLN